MVKKLLIGLGVVVGLLGVFALVVAMQPAEYRVTRTATIDAPPAAVFAHVNDLHKWDAWSPWAKRDPNAKNTFEGAEAGKGAIFRWAGNDQVGEGSMTIVESRPPELIDIKLEFLKPFEDSCDVQFKFKPAGEQDEQTLVAWEMHGKKNFIAKAMCMFMSMDKMIGGDFEEGLANMKKVAETQESETKDAASDDPQASDPSAAATP